MRTRNLFASALSGVLLLGCATAIEPRLLPRDCTEVICHIKISVDDGKVVVDPPIARVTGNQFVQLQWHLAHGLEFSVAGDGIEFKGDTRDQFYDGKVTQDKKNFFWRDKNTLKGSFDYWVTFHDSQGRRYRHDPTIMNDAS